jgi:hypothetical protein
MNKMSAMQSANTKVTAIKNTMEMEIKTDKQRGVDTSKKEEQLEKLTERQSAAEEMFGQEIANVNDQVKEASKNNETDKTEETDPKDSEQTLAEKLYGSKDIGEAYSVDINLPGIKTNKTKKAEVNASSESQKIDVNV